MKPGHEKNCNRSQNLKTVNLTDLCGQRKSGVDGEIGGSLQCRFLCVLTLRSDIVYRHIVGEGFSQAISGLVFGVTPIVLAIAYLFYLGGRATLHNYTKKVAVATCHGIAHYRRSKTPSDSSIVEEV